MSRLSSLLIIITSVLVCLPVSQASAKLIVAGNTNPSNGVFQGTLNAAVYDLTGGTASDSYGTGYAGMDRIVGGANQDYLFLYSVTNVGPSAESIFHATVAISAGSVASSDMFTTALHFVDSDGPVTAASDNDLGYDTRVFANNDEFSAISAADVLSVGLAEDSSLKRPWLTLSASPGRESIDTFGMFIYPALAPGETSAIVGFKGDSNGTRTIGMVNGAFAHGQAPSTVPEPGTALALLSLVPIMGAMWYRRRRR